MPQHNRPLTWDYLDFAELSSPPVLAFLDHWKSKVRDGRMPARRDIDPLAFPQYLKHCMILDVEGPGLFRYRLFGTHITEGNVQDLTGHLLGIDVLGNATPAFLHMYNRVCVEKAPIAARGNMFWQGRDHAAFEQVSLPLSEDGDAVNKILGVVCFKALDERC